MAEKGPFIVHQCCWSRVHWPVQQNRTLQQIIVWARSPALKCESLSAGCWRCSQPGNMLQGNYLFRVFLTEKLWADLSLLNKTKQHFSSLQIFQNWLKIDCGERVTQRSAAWVSLHVILAHFCSIYTFFITWAFCLQIRDPFPWSCERWAEEELLYRQQGHGRRGVSPFFSPPISLFLSASSLSHTLSAPLHESEDPSLLSERVFEGCERKERDSLISNAKQSHLSKDGSDTLLVSLHPLPSPLA